MNGAIVRTEEIMNALERKNKLNFKDTNNVRVHISRINKKVGTKLIKNKHWFGYYIDEPIRIF